MTLELGMTVECRITRIGMNALWVGMPNGKTGKVPTEELSWSIGLINLLNSYFVGQQLRAVVHHIPHEGPPILSVRRVEGDPWNKAEERFPVGTVIHGQVVGLEDYGAFVELDEAPGLVGLVHISQLGPRERY